MGAISLGYLKEMFKKLALFYIDFFEMQPENRQFKANVSIKPIKYL